LKDYKREMEIAIIRINVIKDRETIMTRFFNGLNREITNIVELQHYVKLKNMVYIAMQVEGQLKMKGNV
jgi:hypothetical protein